MDLLHELVFVVELNPSRSFSLLLPEGSKLNALYQLVKQDEFLTDESAAATLYGCSPTDKRYLMLKRNLTSKLSELILISELGDTERTSTKFHLEQRLTIAGKLLLQNVYHNAEKIGKKVRRQAQKECLTEVQLRALQLLRKVYSLKGDRKAFQKIAAEYTVIRKEAAQEENTLFLVQEIESVVKYSVASLPTAVAHLQATFEGPLFGGSGSQLTLYYRLKLQIYHAWHTYNLMAMATPLASLEKLLAENPTLQTSGNRLFWMLHQARHFMALGRFGATRELLEQANKLTSYQAFDRFEVAAEWFIYHMRRLELPQAWAIVKEVKKSPQYDRLHSIDQSLWYVRGVYVYWCALALRRRGMLSQVGTDFRNFTLDELYQNTAAISRDKGGGNLHVMLLRGLFSVLDMANQELAFDTGNTLIVYFQRYLRETPELRVALFFKSIAKLLKRSSDPQKVNRLHHKLLAGLNETPQQFDPNEWIPFREIWNGAVMTELSS